MNTHTDQVIIRDARRDHRRARYPGDLASDVRNRMAVRRRITRLWTPWLAVGVSTAAACVLVTVVLTTEQPAPIATDTKTALVDDAQALQPALPRLTRLTAPTTPPRPKARPEALRKPHRLMQVRLGAGFPQRPSKRRSIDPDYNPKPSSNKGNQTWQHAPNPLG